MPDTAAPAAFYEPPTIPIAEDRHKWWQVMFATLRNPLNLWTRTCFTENSFTAHWGTRTFMHVMSPALARQVLLDDADCFVKSYMQDRLLKPALGDGLLTSDGAEWRFQRRAAAPAFRHDTLQQLVPVMASAGGETARRLVSLIGEGARIRRDIHEEMMRATFDVIAQTLLSATEMTGAYTKEQLLKDVGAFLETVGRFNMLDMLDAPAFIPRALGNPQIIRGHQAITRIRTYAREQIRARLVADTPGDDLLGMLIAARDPETGQHLNEQQLIDNLVTFIGAGHETTALALTWTLSIISAQPELQAHLAAEALSVLGDGPVTAEALPKLELHERVIMETLRLYPPAPVIPRSVAHAVTVDGTNLKPGDHVAVAIYPLHRHEKVWENPHAFDPDRFLPGQVKARDRFAWIPFGAGPRICIGMKLSMMEAVTILASLTPRFIFYPDPAYKVEPVMTVTLRPRGGMPLFVEPR